MEHSDTCFQNIIITASFNLEFTAVFSQYNVHTHINETGEQRDTTYLPAAYPSSWFFTQKL
jgi:hypothetical protein